MSVLPCDTPPHHAAHATCLARMPDVDVYEGLTEVLEEAARSCGSLTVLAARSRRTWPFDAGTPSPAPTEPMAGFFQVPTLAYLFAAAVRECLRHRRGPVIGCDPLGNVVSAVIAALFKRPYVHYGLELPPMRQGCKGFTDRLIRWSHRRADILVTMDPPHADFICRETGALRERILLIPNCRRGPARAQRTRALRNRFGLSDADVIVLHAGGIGAAQASLELANAAKDWKHGHHLVFHAHCPMEHEPYYREFRRFLSDCSNVHLNERSVSSEELDAIIGSADIGMAWYDRKRLGVRAELLGLAAGKIGRCLRNGVPVIACDLPTVRAYIDKYRCGICVQTASEIAPAIETIMSDYAVYASNAVRCYEELWRPDRRLAEFRTRLDALIGNEAQARKPGGPADGKN